VLVGLAVMAGMQAFAKFRKKTAEDAHIAGAYRLATTAHAWYLQLAEFGGGNSTTERLANLTYGQQGISSAGVSDEAYVTPWGTI
jgi:hypothetical protein